MVKQKTLRELIARLNSIAKEIPEALDLPLVYSQDDEGNGFHRVYCDAGLGHYDESCNDFTSAEGTNEEVNCICIN
jgi:hypothetical protein